MRCAVEICTPPTPLASLAPHSSWCARVCITNISAITVLCCRVVVFLFVVLCDSFTVLIMKRKSVLPWDVDDIAVYNKGQKREDGTKQQRFFLRTKIKHQGKLRNSYDADVVGLTESRLLPGFNGVFKSKDEAKEYIPYFLAWLNGTRVQQSRQSKLACKPNTIQGKCDEHSPMCNMTGLDDFLRQKREQVKAIKTQEREVVLYKEFRKVTRSEANIVGLFTNVLAGQLRADARPGLIADLIQIFYDAESARIEEERLQRSLRRLDAKKKSLRLRSSYPSYILQMQNGQMQRLRKWAAARDHLGRFLAEGSVEGLVHTPDGIDLSSNGNNVILRKAQLVHTYFSIRLLGVPRAQAVEMVGASVTQSMHMSSQATLYRYIKEYFELKVLRVVLFTSCFVSYFSPCS